MDKDFIVNLVGDLESLNIETIKDDNLEELGFPNLSATLKCRTSATILLSSLLSPYPFIV